MTGTPFGALTLAVITLTDDTTNVAMRLTPIDGDGACRHTLRFDSDDLETLIAALLDAGGQAFGWELEYDFDDEGDSE